MHNKNIGHLIGHIAYIALYGVLIISAVILYNSAHLVALLYLGLVTLLLGIIFLLWSSQSRKKGRIEEGINKETLVESGMYAFVRHPEFLGHIVIIMALILIAQHWISMIIATALIVLLCFAMVEEEKRNIEKFGEAYKDYMRRVPRINLLIGIIRGIHEKKENKEEK